MPASSASKEPDGVTLARAGLREARAALMPQCRRWRASLVPRSARPSRLGMLLALADHQQGVSPPCRFPGSRTMPMPMPGLERRPSGRVLSVPSTRNRALAEPASFALENHALAPSGWSHPTATRDRSTGRNPVFTARAVRLINSASKSPLARSDLPRASVILVGKLTDRTAGASDLG